MPWDCFCPKCSAVCLGSMTADPEIIEQEMKEHKGSIVNCHSCGTTFNFDTHEIIEE
jgi:transcription elongation factor Elf1